jgi:hypothetical protein
MLASLGVRARRTDRLAAQLAADLLPEAGDSEKVGAGLGLWPGVELRGFEPLTSCMPSMRRWFTTPHSTSRPRTTAQVGSAVGGGVVRRGEVACSAVSGKFLARR